MTELSAISEEYAQWFMQAARRAAYPESQGAQEPPARPDSFESWASRAEEGGIAPERLEKLQTLHADLSALADRILQSGKPAEFEEFDRLATAFEEFSGDIRRLVRDALFEIYGLDPLTGLRIPAVMGPDMAREMERLARGGSPFCLALVRIDNLQEIKGSLGEDQADDVLRRVAAVLKAGLRSFDDAYRLETDEFVLFLKQSDVNGGVRTLERLKRALNAANIHYEAGEGPAGVTLSACIAEPVTGDDPAELLKNLKTDLDAAAGQAESVFEYIEMSPLQRYAKTPH